MYKATINIDRELWDKFKNLCREEYNKTASELLRETIVEELGDKRRWEIDDHHYLEQDISQNSYQIRKLGDKVKQLEDLVAKLTAAKTYEGWTDKETDKETDNWTDSQTDKETDKETDSQTDSETDSETDNWTDKAETDSETDSQTDSETDSQTDSETDSQTDSQTDKETDNWTDKAETDSETDSETDAEFWNRIATPIEAINLKPTEPKTIEVKSETIELETSKFTDKEVAAFEGVTSVTVYRYRRKISKPSLEGFWSRWKIDADGTGWLSLVDPIEAQKKG